MNILILEDSPERIKWFTEAFESHRVIITNDAKFAGSLVTFYNFDFVFLDHDLGGTQMNSSFTNTGTETAQMIADSGEKPTVIIHSWNPNGTSRMLGILQNAEVPTRVHQFGSFDKSIVYN